TGEIRTLMSLGSETPSESIKSLVLNDPEAPLVGGANVNGASVLIPSAGQGNFTELQAYVAKNTSNDPAIREGANIVVMNGTGTTGLGQVEADKLTAANFTVSAVTNAPTNDYEKTTIYRINKENTSGTAKA